MLKLRLKIQARDPKLLFCFFFFSFLIWAFKVCFLITAKWYVTWHSLAKDVFRIPLSSLVFKKTCSNLGHLFLNFGDRINKGNTCSSFSSLDRLILKVDFAIDFFLFREFDPKIFTSSVRRVIRKEITHLTTLGTLEKQKWTNNFSYLFAFLFFAFSSFVPFFVLFSFGWGEKFDFISTERSNRIVFHFINNMEEITGNICFT